MNKKVFGKKFSRDSTSRRAMYRALVRSFVENKKMVTTYSKARVVVPIIEKLITKAKRNSVSDRRFIYSFTGNDRLVADKIFELSKAITPGKGGFLKYINLPARKGDNAPIARVELVQKIVEKTIVKEDKAEGKKNKKKEAAGDQKATERTEKKTLVPSVLQKLSLRKKVAKH
jgi:large subunit ribosomal protein L17